MKCSAGPRFLRLLAIVMLVGVLGCPKQRPISVRIPTPPPPVAGDGHSPPPVPHAAKDGHPGTKALPPREDYAVVRVFYATDRQPTGEKAPGKFYSGDRQIDESLHLGTLDVSIPRDHQPGHIERPVWWKLEFRETPERDVVLLNVVPQSEQQFYSELSNKVETSPGKDAFIFIHGFDNTFEQAAWRTAQLSYDLGFKGAPIMYSWPSKGGMSDYLADEATIEWAAPHLEKFLETVAVQSHATTVHLIAHSMGNRALTRALAAIATKHAGVPPMFKHVFLAAPDIDVGVYRQLAAVFPSAAARVTLYASSKDRAIITSEKLHQFDRVGDSMHICVVPNVDTIDASAVDTSLIGHSYFGDNTSILSDILSAMETGNPADKRAGMHKMTMQQLAYWAYQP
jgi:esterase/lipase superfamily enzyme